MFYRGLLCCVSVDGSVITINTASSLCRARLSRSNVRCSASTAVLVHHGSTRDGCGSSSLPRLSRRSAAGGGTRGGGTFRKVVRRFVVFGPVTLPRIHYSGLAALAIVPFCATPFHEMRRRPIAASAVRFIFNVRAYLKRL